MPYLFRILPVTHFYLLIIGIVAVIIIVFWGGYRYFVRLRYESPEEKRKTVFLVVSFALSALGIVVAGYFYYIHQERNYRTEAEHLLTFVADLKTGELIQWRRERLGDGFVLYKNKEFARLTERVAEQPGDMDARNRIWCWLEAVWSAYSYKNIIYLDRTGRALVSIVKPKQSICEEIRKHINKIGKMTKPFFLDLHREAADGSITLSLLVPIYEKARFCGVVALIIDPNTYLYPMLQRWPIPSETGETLLVRQAGESVEFLNDLRFRKNVALTVRYPLSGSNLPAARAVRGEEGIVEDLDYRGIRVLAALKGVAGSPWFVVVKIDLKEIFTPLRERLLLTVIAVVLCIGATGTFVLFLWHRRNAHFTIKQVEMARVLEASEDKFRKIFLASPDAMAISRWNDEQIVSVNHGFQTLTGYTQEEAENGSIERLHLWKKREEKERALGQIKTFGMLINEEFRFRRKTGDTFYGLLSACFLNLVDAPHILWIIRDITDKKLVENERFRLMDIMDKSLNEIYIFDAHTLYFEYLNQGALKNIGYTMKEMKTLTPVDIKPEFSQETFREMIKPLIEQKRERLVFETIHRRKDGTEYPVEVYLQLYKQDGKNVFYAVINDITERKETEEKLNRLNEELETRVRERTAELASKNAELERINRVFVDRELKMRELKARIAKMEEKQ